VFQRCFVNPRHFTGEWARVHISGTTEAGVEFQNTRSVGGPIAFVVGSNQVVLGVDYGVAGMKVGGSRKLVVPPHLGYGFRRVGDIAPDSVR
jgi:FKBP-type peptidyl-prolyl cis-trans isomerase